MSYRRWFSYSILFLVGIILVSFSVAWMVGTWQGLKTEVRGDVAKALQHNATLAEALAGFDSRLAETQRRLAGREARTISPEANCWSEALAAYWYGGVALMRGEDADGVYGAVAKELRFDPELAALWDRAKTDEEAFRLFTFLLQARAAHGGCP